jgi:hypothetical protein
MALVLVSLLQATILATSAVPAAQAAMVQRFDLEQLSALADRIFRGTVVDMSKGTVAAGGGELPTITYVLEVHEPLKGAFPASAGDGATRVSITSLDLPIVDLPRLSLGQDYLLLTTAPSAVGLSTMVGLGQGTFRVYGEPGAELAVNALDNAGLAAGLRGPAPYAALAERIRAMVSREPRP